ncbi:uncharacterized protein LOC110830453 [Zootermopsis nevadensis]|uniref:[Phe13]-bombesin receptor n=1 Tax=Zootermopsis nevadensis TaxID=136037 RepID=A0A067R6F3_ZOONE|nr:uncharacterized protein LOC110830453 [Zootermopsis nevadensis]KDR18865.1 [Phe13]-bombesin receptor [Zootermopsis nevadensis]
MINRNVVIITVTALHLMTTEMYEARAAATFGENDISTNATDNPSGADYEEGMTTESGSNFHNASDESSEAFDISQYRNNCTEDFESENETELKPAPYAGGSVHHLGPTALELREDFQLLLKAVARFGCTANESLGREVISMSREYVDRGKDFLGRLSGQDTTASDERHAFDAGMYEASILRAESLMELVDQMTDLMAEHARIDVINDAIIKNSKEIIFSNRTLVWEINVRLKENVTRLLDKCLQTAANMSKYKEQDDLLAVLIPNHTRNFFDVRQWADLLENETETLQIYRTNLFAAERDRFIAYTVKPAVTATVFVVGMAGNGLLLTIFVRHKETRTFPNSMLMNLTAVDCASLIVNLLLEYFRVLWTWRLGLPMCKIFYFSRYVLIAVSIYSVVMISVQRFLAVTQLPSGVMCRVGKKTKYVFMVTIWALGFILSVPHALIADVKNGLCHELSFEYFGPVSTTDLVVFCVVPVVLVAVFSGLTATRIRRSVCRIPGEGAGKERLRHNRIVSSTILIALVALFVVSYTPDFLYKFLTIQVAIPTPSWQFNMVNVVTYYLRFVNCCLNPVILFVMSKRYRAYMKKYVGCGGGRKELDAGKSDDTYETSL